MCRIHLKTLSTGTPHPAGHREGTLKHKYKLRSYLHSIQTSDNHLGILTVCAESNDLVVWNWKIGTVCLVRPPVLLLGAPQDHPLVLTLPLLQTARHRARDYFLGIPNAPFSPRRSNSLETQRRKWEHRLHPPHRRHRSRECPIPRPCRALRSQLHLRIPLSADHR